MRSSSAGKPLSTAAIGGAAPSVWSVLGCLRVSLTVSPQGPRSSDMFTLTPPQILQAEVSGRSAFNGTLNVSGGHFPSGDTFHLTDVDLLSASPVSLSLHCLISPPPSRILVSAELFRALALSGEDRVHVALTCPHPPPLNSSVAFPC